MPNVYQPIHTQPTINSTMGCDALGITDLDEKGSENPQQCHECHASNVYECDGKGCPTARIHQSRCHGSRLRRIVVPTIAAILSISVVFALSCMFDIVDIFSWGVDGLARRDTGGGNGSSGGTFVDNKLYLIIIFVGLFLVLILGIMLSAWCCKGSFENPLCCPCYLCACCGGLACLECIGCGLCAGAAADIA